MEVLEMKVDVETRLANDEDIIDIVTETGIPYKMVKKIKDEWENKNEADAIVTMAKADPEVVTRVVKKMTDTMAETGISQGDVDNVIRGVKGLELLDSAIQKSCMGALERADKLMASDKLTPAQWKTLVDGIANMYSQIFVRQGTNINIMNNNGASDATVNSWKQSLR